MYGVATALGKSFALITFPLLARHFSTAEYGVLDFLYSASALLSTLLVFGQDSAVARFVASANSDVERRRMSSESLVAQVTLSVAAAVVGAILAADMASVVSDDLEGDEIHRSLLVILATVPFQIATNHALVMLKWNFKRTQFLALSLGSIGANLLGLVVAVLVFDCGIAGALLVTLVCRIASAFVGCLLIRRWLCWPKRFQHLRSMSRFAVPYGIICVIGAFTPVLERSVIGESLGAEDLGLYATAAKLASIMVLAVSAFETAWGPFHLAIYREPNAQRTFDAVLMVMAGALGVGSLVLAAAAPFLIGMLASDRYMGAEYAVFPLAMAASVRGIGWVLSIGIGISLRAGWGLVGEIVAVAATILALMVLTSRFGIFGTACGVLIGQLVRAAGGHIAAQHVHRLPWRLAGAIAVCGSAVAFGIVGTALLGMDRVVGSTVLGVGSVFVTLATWIAVPAAQRALVVRLLFASRRH